MSKNFKKGQHIVRAKGPNKGREAEMLGSPGKDDKGKVIITVKYCDTGQPAYYCRPHNYIAKELWVEKPYKPRSETVDHVKRWLASASRIVDIGSDRYVPIFYDWACGWRRILQRLMDDGFIENVGQLGDVFKSHGLLWRDYRDDRSSKHKRPFGYSVITYKVLKDVSKFSW